MRFIYAKELKKKYTVWSSFYKLIYDDGEEIECRSVLEIYKKPDYEKLKKKDKPQVIFIMMNPGKSKPYNDDVIIPVMKECEIINNKEVKTHLILTKPDPTQYQIMRIMEEKQWQHVRVLNLSDCRQPKSDIFYQKVHELKVHDKNCIHSIFSKYRANEFKKHLNSSIEKVIVAWGIDEELDELIKQAISSKKINKRIGVNVNNDKIHYSHAGPQLYEDKIKWLKNILNVLNE